MDSNFRVFSLAKYTTQFKLDVVLQYLGGEIGLKTLGREYELDHGMVRRWVNLYKAHGEAGLEKKFTAYSASQKLAMLQHMWDHELSYGQVSSAFNIRSPTSISTWERCYHRGGIDVLMPRKRGRPKKMPESQSPKVVPSTDDETRSREELLAEVNYLRMENAYLKKLRALVPQQLSTTARKKCK